MKFIMFGGNVLLELACFFVTALVVTTISVAILGWSFIISQHCYHNRLAIFFDTHTFLYVVFVTLIFFLSALTYVRVRPAFFGHSQA